MKRRSPHREAWFIAQFVPDLVDLDQVVLRLLPQLGRGRERTVKAAIVAAIVGLLERMERGKLVHRDLKASNILLENFDGVGGPPTVWLVDLEGLHRRRVISASRRWHPIMRLAASLLAYTSVTRTDYCRFLRAYLTRRDKPEATWKRHFRQLAAQADDYVRRARRRKTHKLDGYTGD